MSKELFEVLRLADQLSPDEQLELISYLVQRLRNCDIKRKPRRNVMEFAGVAPNLLGGMDAQEYVNRIRRGEFPELEIQQQESEKQE
ncbi:MAG TPA: hypothetical protein DDW76_12510 [Cyanobacteria bacterium UBA11369]|nr:hypothetical protein [Cyanobacteria bacterium UBA11371]HBE21747.1 hypothetical protein [Cyanobacteria bacterium UBA11367]HBE35429.1 hypothetical protein [Cyanobacteria bacterium UBA11368]HBE49587.1 hypothetical protein [Cyanobacteria bacterium UBA11369]